MLNDRERAILVLLMRGKTQKGVANRIGMSFRHTQYLIRALRNKLGARSVTHMAAIALAKGLLPNPIEVKE